MADTIEEWFDQGAADGFNVMPAALPSGLHRVRRSVIPMFRQAGCSVRSTPATTLREHYGFPRPGSKFTAHRRGVPEPVA